MVSYTVTNVHLIILSILDTSLSSYLLDLYSLSNDRLSVIFLNSLLYLLISVCLLTGQFSDRSTAALLVTCEYPSFVSLGLVHLWKTRGSTELT